MTSLQLDKFANIRSPIQRWDARWKLSAGVLFIFSVAALEQLAPAASALAIGIVLVTLARLPMAGVLHRLRAIAGIVAVVVIVLALTGGGPRVEFAGLPLSKSGLVAGARMALKALAIMVTLIAVTATSPTQQNLAALRWFRLPDGLVQVIYLTYRYLFVLQSESHSIRQAMRARAFTFQFNGRTLGLLGNAVGMLLVRSIERADRVYLAMQARGYDGSFHTVTHWRSSASDVAKFAALFTTAGMLIVSDCILRGR